MTSEAITVEEITIPARGARVVTLRPGDRVTVVDVEGQQVGDLVALVEGTPEFLSVSHTRTKLGKLSIAEGDILWSNLRRPVLRVTRDTVARHDLLWAACDPQRYGQDFGVSGHANCRENLHRVLGGRVPYDAVPDPVNIFMASTVQPDGTLDVELPQSRAGDEITFDALLPCTVAVSACPQDLNACNGYNPTPLQLRVERRGGTEQGGLDDAAGTP
ncbi:MAG TPA: urea carboxylase-associated family protein [Chloroflexota bacterium]|nr:urea carboxylase-associated family protein [Chloroflexota bacterium]